MVRLRKPRTRKHGGMWERIWSRTGGAKQHTPVCCKPRRLMLDQLEERTLLSVTAGGVSDQLVNQALMNVTNANATLAAKSVASDNNGDFVVVWTQNDGVYDANGNQVIDSSTQSAMIDDNVYARYYTQAMQRIDLPVGATSFQLQYNGNEIQELTISGGSAPYSSTTNFNNNITGSFTLLYWDPAAGIYRTTGAIQFDETATLAQNAGAIQSALNNLGRSSNVAALKDVTVQAVDADHYMIDFGAGSGGNYQTALIGDINGSGGTTTLSGFYPAVTAAITRTPGATITIPVSNSPSLTAAQNWAQTAQNIEYAFQQTSSDVLTAPIFFPSSLELEETLGNDLGPYYDPTSAEIASPAVSVTAERHGVRHYFYGRRGLSRAAAHVGRGGFRARHPVHSQQSVASAFGHVCGQHGEGQHGPHQF